MKFIKYIIVCAVLMFSVDTYALTENQEYVKNVAKHVGSKHCIEDMCFGKTLQAIAWQESSFGRNIIGDDKGASYFYLHNNQQVKIKKKNSFIENGQRYYWYQPHNIKYRKMVYSKTVWKPIEDSSLGSFQIKVQTAKRIIRVQELKRYYYLLEDDKILVSLLLNNPEFSAKIAVHYLMMNYATAIKRGYKYPWRYVVSKYNGGSNNTKYINKIVSKIRRLDNL